MSNVERAIFDLRRGESVLVADESDACLAVAVEALGGEGERRLGDFTGSPARVILTSARAEALGRGPTEGPVAVTLDAKTSLAEQALRWAAGEPQPSFNSTAASGRSPTAVESAALSLARAAFVLPAVVVVRVQRRHPRLVALCTEGEILCVSPAAVRRRAREEGQRLHRVSEARIPLSGIEESRFVLFREANGLREHVAVLVGDAVDWSDPVPLRLHSACLTGDLFGSLRCDCGEQLRAVVGRLAAAGGGVLLYLAQEGRGIGLANKLRAYGIQDEGLDTVDADRRLGFDADERHYAAAVAMLAALGIGRVQLLTNNPAKIRALADGGIEVVGRDALLGQRNRHNARYLDAKARRAGHWLGEAESTLGGKSG